MIIERSNHFKKGFQKLPKNIQELFIEKIKLFVQSKATHPSLRVKKIKGTSTIWEFSLNMNYRVTFEMIDGGVFLRKIGTHDVLDRP